jgi:hypothetical protein
VGKQIGNDSEGGAPVFRKSIYGKSDGGKGSRPRINTHSKQYADNWDAIFGEKKNAKKTKK